MNKTLRKLFIRPDKVLKNDYGIYVVVLFICILSIATTLILLTLAIVLSIWPLLFLNLFGLGAALYVIYLNRIGSHMLAIGLYSACMYLYAVNSAIIFGWQAGFQYYLIPLTTLFFLHNEFKNKFAVLFGLFPFCTFLLLYNLPLELLNGQERFSTFLHAYNAFNVFLALAFVNFYFRTSVYRLLYRLDKSSNTDMLTGLMNRRKMTVELSRYCNITERYDNKTAILLIDIDNFKRINDELGHIVGDSILQQFTKLLASQMRDSDLLARWGGDEFLVLAPSTTHETAEQLASNFCQTIAAHDFIYENRILNLSITVGVNELLPQRTMEDSLKKVDQLLYQGKHQGRNQVVSEK